MKPGGLTRVWHGLARAINHFINCQLAGYRSLRTLKVCVLAAYASDVMHMCSSITALDERSDWL
jgi:hypothetical protein